MLTTKNEDYTKDDDTTPSEEIDSKRKLVDVAKGTVHVVPRRCEW